MIQIIIVRLIAICFFIVLTLLGLKMLFDPTKVLDKYRAMFDKKTEVEKAKENAFQRLIRATRYGAINIQFVALILTLVSLFVIYLLITHLTQLPYHPTRQQKPIW